MGLLREMVSSLMIDIAWIRNRQGTIPVFVETNGQDPSVIELPLSAFQQAGFQPGDYVHVRGKNRGRIMTVASNESVEKNRGRISPEMQGKLQVPQSGKLRIRSSPQVQEANQLVLLPTVETFRILDIPPSFRDNYYLLIHDGDVVQVGPMQFEVSEMRPSSPAIWSPKTQVDIQYTLLSQPRKPKVVRTFRKQMDLVKALTKTPAMAHQDTRTETYWEMLPPAYEGPAH